MLYILSREWEDLLSVDLLRLRPLPYCGMGASHSTPCTSPKAVYLQALFAGGLVLIAVVIHDFVTRLLPRFPSIALLLPMAGMAVGWAAGDASVQLMHELTGSVTGALIFSLVLTMIAIGLTALIQPLSFTPAPERPCCPTVAWRAEESAVQDPGSKPLTRALSGMVMLTWASALSQMVSSDVAAQVKILPVYHRMLFFWAISLTGVLAALNVKLTAWRQRLLEAVNGQSRETATSVTAAESGEEELDRDHPLTTFPDSAPALSASSASKARRETRIRKAERARAALSSSIALVEGIFGWVTGCAWTDAWVAYLGTTTQYPTFAVTGADFGYACAATALAVGWLALTGDGSGLDGILTAREKVERYFLTNALSFVVGWAWVVVVRDLTTLISNIGAPGWNALRQGICVFIFGPVLTLVFMRVKAGMRRWDSTQGMDEHD